MSFLKLVVLISGRGSNLQALLEAAQSDALGVDIVAVISNRPDAQGLERAARFGVPTAVVDHTAFSDRRAFEQALSETIDAYDADWIALAGFMRILNAEFVRHYQGRLLNIHPSLLPKYRGLNTHARVLAAGG